MADVGGGAERGESEQADRFSRGVAGTVQKRDLEAAADPRAHHRRSLEGPRHRGARRSREPSRQRPLSRDHEQVFHAPSQGLVPEPASEATLRTGSWNHRQLADDAASRPPVDGYLGWHRRWHSDWHLDGDLKAT
jgi:hypothetical protein